jgi:hypothetical protein
MKFQYALKTAISQKFDFVACAFKILFENPEIMSTSFMLCNRYNRLV